MLGLEDKPETPIVAFIGRLAPQKGVDLIEQVFVLCIPVCMYVCIHTDTLIFRYIRYMRYIHVYMNVCLFVYDDIAYMYVCMYVCMYVSHLSAVSQRRR